MPAEVDPATGYRRYREDQLATARLVGMLRRLDLPLTGVRDVLDACGPRAAELIAEHWTGVERRVASQRELAAHLRIMLSDGEGNARMYEIDERDVPEQLVLTEQRRIREPHLDGWLDEAIGRLIAAAGGEPAGEVFVVYYGEVDEDADGPVEVCVPVEHASDGAASRTEPAHRVAFTRLAKAQVEYPQILSAYDAVERWIIEQQRTAAGPPREVYFGDWDAAGPDDQVCDVAFPVR